MAEPVSRAATLATPGAESHRPLARFRPALVDSLRSYTRAELARDISAGLTVGVVALPLAMAFGIASGVAPEAGIYTAIIAGFLISALGGSRVQIGGPAGAFIVIVYGIVAKYGLANLLIATLCAGVLMFLMGLFRLGSLIRFIPVSIVIGFTNGIAVLVALSQVKDFLGLAIDKMPADFFHQAEAIVGALGTINPAAVAIALASLALVVLWPKTYRMDGPRWKKWLAHLPGTVIVLVVATLGVTLLHLPVDTIGSKFGGIPQGLPAFALPAFSWESVKQLVGPTLTIALLGAIESLLCARVADGMTDERHDPNQELMGQGVANFVAPFFGGIPATGTIARTVTNIKSGAASPVAGMVHALTLLAIVLVAAPLAMNVPLAALAAILMFVAWNMGEWREFARLRQFNLTYRTTLLATFFLTVVFDLTVAVEVGLVLASLFFIYRMSTLTRVVPLPLPAAAPAGTEAWLLEGALFFGSVSKLESVTDPRRLNAPGGPRVVILDLSETLSLDTSALDAIEALDRTLAKRHAHLILAAAEDQPRSLLERSGFAAHLGANLVPDLDAAVTRAAALAGAPGPANTVPSA